MITNLELNRISDEILDYAEKLSDDKDYEDTEVEVVLSYVTKIKEDEISLYEQIMQTGVFDIKDRIFLYGGVACPKLRIHINELDDEVEFQITLTGNKVKTCKKSN